MSSQPFLSDPVVIESRWEGDVYVMELFAEGTGSDGGAGRHRGPHIGRVATEDMWEIQEALARIVPEKVLLDLALPIRRGVELVQIVKETCPNASIVARVRSNGMETRSYSLELESEGLKLAPVPEPTGRAS